MDQKSDREKRQDYLTQISTARIVLVMIVLGCLLFASLAIWYWSGRHQFAFIFSVVFCLLGLLDLWAVRIQFDYIRYAPPVPEQLTAVPDEEILLRGTGAPPASPDELLRSVGTQQTPAEEMLRAASRGMAE